MSKIGLAAIALTVAVGSSGFVRAQEGHGFTPQQIERGEQIFLSNCANCHGPDGDSIPGTDLASGKFRHATTERDLINIIQKGIPGTPMPPSNYPDAQAEMIVGYLYSMKAALPADRSALKGDIVRGRAIFEGEGKCLTCHRANENGSSFLGPDLSDIGTRRRSVDLQRSIVDPSAQIRADSRTLRATAKDGKTIMGRLLNQDTYSFLILMPTGKLAEIEKATLSDFQILKTSPMPSYKDKLNPQQIADLVSYLANLKGR